MGFNYQELLQATINGQRKDTARFLFGVMKNKSRPFI
jgi:hypothetical protein